MKEKHKILYLDHSIDNFYMNEISKYNIETDVYIKRYDQSRKQFKKFPILIVFPFLFFFLGKWKYSIYRYKVIIITANFLAPRITKLINTFSKSTRVIIWYWNSVKYDIDPLKFINLNCELWTFDAKDSKNYNMYLNNQFYFNTIELLNRQNKIDIVFVGADKGRLSKILELQKQFEKLKLKTYLHIVNRDSNNLFTKKEEMQYSIYLNHVAESKAILDITQDFQTGLTLRPLEALFFNKKLITNNINIKNYDFYKREMIFIIGEDNFDDLFDFINNKSSYEKNIKDKYDFESWLHRIV